MDNEIKSRIASYMDAIEQAAEQGAGFVGEQAPLLAQEYVAWYFWSAMLGVLLGVSVLLAAGWISWWAYSSRTTVFWDEKHKVIRPEILFPFAVSILMLAAGVFIAGVNTYMVVKVSVAPRVVLLEKVQELVK